MAPPMTATDMDKSWEELQEAFEGNQSYNKDKILWTLTAETKRRETVDTEDQIFPEQIPESFDSKGSKYWSEDLSPDMEEGLSRANRELTLIREALSKNKPTLPETEPNKDADVKEWKKYWKKLEGIKDGLSLIKDSRTAKNNWIQAWEAAKTKENDILTKKTTGK